VSEGLMLLTEEVVA